MTDPRTIRRIVLFSLVLAGGRAHPAAGQPRPLPVETVAGVGSGNLLLQVGADYTRDERFPLSGLDGNLLRVALIRIDVGLSSIADLEISGGLRDRLAITSTTPAVLSGQLQLSDPTTTSAFDDVDVGTKVRLLGERSDRPGVAIQIATRLPNAKHPSGLGQDTMDFYNSLIVGQSVSGVHVTLNAGLGILGDPLRGNRHVESLLYGLLLDRGMTTRTALVAGVEGRTGPMDPGLEPRSIGRAGVVWSRGPARVEVDGTVGLTRYDGNVGVSVNAGFSVTPLPHR